MAFRSATSLADGARTNSTLSAPAGLANDDILVLVLLAYDTELSPTPPSGFTQWLNIDHADRVLDLWVWWKRASSESGSYTITHGSCGTEGWLGAFSGRVTSGDPADGDQSEAQGSSTTYTASGVTPTVDDADIIYIAGTYANQGTGTPPSGSTPTFTERYDAGNTIFVATGALATAGATGSKSRSAGTDTEWMATLIAIKAPGAAPAGNRIAMVV
jgi:hypothetical protein